jgi:hypothetical protein
MSADAAEADEPVGEGDKEGDAVGSRKKAPKFAGTPESASKLEKELIGTLYKQRPPLVRTS